MPADLFADAGLRPAAKPLTIFRAELIGHENASWEELFAGYTSLKAITFSSSVEFLVRLADRLDDAEIVFGSESILSKEQLALAQASQTVAAYGFADALADHKALTEALARLLGRGGRILLTRVVAGSLRFRLLRGRPSHEKLYLLSGPAGCRVLTGSANLSLAAFEGRQQEIYVAFDGEPAWRLFDGYYQRDWRDSVSIARDARLLSQYLSSFLSFFGNASGAVEVYWAFLAWLYAAPTAPYLRQAAVPVGIDPWVYPVYAVLFGRSSGGKTVFTRVAARSMFGFEKMIRSGQFTANRALGLRDRLGAIPLLIDHVTRDKFTSHVPDLVRTDQEMGSQYAPVVLTTNRDVSTIPPDLTKRMVTCHIDAAIPENRSVTARIARRAQREIGTALYRAYLQRLIPEVRAMRAEIDAEAAQFPDLLARSSEILRDILGGALGDPPLWARPLGFADYFGIRHRRFRDQLADMLAD